ncbi:hypothetical protein CTA1_10590 [Colletotrichum tanaceti]|uniref:Uncharacterized protein n=1 Tax=Colletotrichum tanaceti TaxID=1306861 RepID=A0A4U6X561_9PEZI|nr:hypothetical protein CTA1_10590 [Colletotrichum tanaceti]
MARAKGKGKRRGQRKGKNKAGVKKCKASSAAYHPATVLASSGKPSPCDPMRCSKCRKVRTRLWNTRYQANDPYNSNLDGLQAWASCNHCMWRQSILSAEDWVELHTPWLFDGYCPCHWFEFGHHDYGYCPTSKRMFGSRERREEVEAAIAKENGEWSEGGPAASPSDEEEGEETNVEAEADDQQQVDNNSMEEVAEKQR